MVLIHFVAPAADFNDVNVKLIIYLYVVFHLKGNRRKRTVIFLFFFFFMVYIISGGKKIGYVPSWWERDLCNRKLANKIVLTKEGIVEF